MNENSEKSKAMVLFVAAEPRGASPIRLGEEFRDIIEEVERKHRVDSLEFRTLWAARPTDVTRALSDFEPVVVHFSGHGTPEGGFLLESTDGTSKQIDTRGMGSIFETYKKKVKVVVLNSCYSQDLAKEIAKYVDVVVGMNDGIGIEAAIQFSVGFYRGLSAGKSLHHSFKMGKTELDFQAIPESHIPALYNRPGGPEAWELTVVAEKVDGPPRRGRASPETSIDASDLEADRDISAASEKIRLKTAKAGRDITLSS